MWTIQTTIKKQNIQSNQVEAGFVALTGLAGLLGTGHEKEYNTVLLLPSSQIFHHRHLPRVSHCLKLLK